MSNPLKAQKIKKNNTYLKHCHFFNSKPNPVKDQESVSDPSEYKLTDDVALLEDSLSKLQQENEGLKQDSYKGRQITGKKI